MTTFTREKIEEMEALLIDNVMVITDTGAEIKYRHARAEVNDGALFVRYIHENCYYTGIYAQGKWREVISSLSQEELVRFFDKQAGRR